MSVPNLLTLLRISLIPILAVAFYLPFHGHHLVAACIFVVAAITDWLDGYLARKLKQVSPLGEFLDPVADKLIVAVALVLLVQTYHTAWLAIPAAIIVSREIVVSALREWMSELGKRQRVAVKGIGKLKTAGQMSAILLLLSQNPESIGWISSAIIMFGYLLIYVAALLTLWSMVVYFQIAWEELNSPDLQVADKAENLPTNQS